uniref:Protein GAST1 n=1 Tax=Solanum tuberosum TaxID=4113 RepID=M0ZLT4_SOLTU
MAGKMSIVLFVLLVVFLTQNQVSRANIMRDEQQQQQRNNQLIVNQNARIGVQRHRIRSRVCFSARNAVQSVCVFLLVPMAISKVALATITGRPREVNLYIQFKSGRCQVLVTQQKVHEQAWEKGIIIQLLYLPVFYFFSSLQTTNLSWNYAAYNVKIGVSAKHKTSQMWTHLLFSLRHPCQGFLQDEISNQAVNAI